jgi:hypothetical protein
MAVVTVHNMCPTSRSKEETPCQLYYGHEEEKYWPQVKDLRQIGCVAYDHEPGKTQRKKLDMKSNQYIRVGYATNAKAYLLWNPRTDAIVQRTSVIFNENQTVTAWVSGRTKIVQVCGLIGESSLLEKKLHYLYRK